MTTSNLELGQVSGQLPGGASSQFADLSAFTPEALLGALPGEHPRMATGLGVGRAASESGQLDIGTLSGLLNELYAEGFPVGSPLAKTGGIPSTASHSDATDPSQLTHPHAITPLATAPISTSQQTPTLSSVPLAVHDAPGLSAKAPPSAGSNSPPLPAQPDWLQPSGLVLDIGNIDALLSFGSVPQQGELQSLLSGATPVPATPASARPAAVPSNSGYYFLNPTSTPDLDTSAHPAFDVHQVRRDFPILQEQINGKQLIWFDNAATTHKPQVVIDRIAYFYAHENSNIHRAAHTLAARATDAYEDARETVRRFLNAPSVDNIVFVRGTTEAINLVAKTWGKKHLGQGDEIVISHLEHHANIVPWQQLCQETGARLKVIPVDDSGQILLDEYQKLLTSKVKLVSFTQVSNALGTVTPAAEMIKMAHRAGARVLLDGAQSVSHMQVDLQALDADFFVFSGHKIFGPTGIGALYGKKEVLDDMPAWQGGGNMIQDVTFDKTVYHQAPAKFEAGTGNIADAVGLGAALKYVERVGIHNIARYEHELLVYATHLLTQVPGLALYGTAKEKASVLSFNLVGYKSEEVGAALNNEGIAVRSGHHCAQPILRRFGQETTVRPSLAFYNTYAEIDVLYQALRRLAAARP
ncbi:family 2A encapsulin nanocompartment cargo protein cysteine desulfurase [Methylobacillus flagellatus]|uniref:family 2A encapsulin nanocompartment cargo protein cysteine desulfurase n=1 Tax=Methylobacillus flagellatus TaxID=405 RepID=UPI0010F863BC|nr:family 2A encapsulin nanocompartment cargo protein cysteine desulfurase [Methylobacillus flagellatus]